MRGYKVIDLLVEADRIRKKDKKKQLECYQKNKQWLIQDEVRRLKRKSRYTVVKDGGW